MAVLGAGAVSDERGTPVVSHSVTVRVVETPFHPQKVQPWWQRGGGRRGAVSARPRRVGVPAPGGDQLKGFRKSTSLQNRQLSVWRFI